MLSLPFLILFHSFHGSSRLLYIQKRIFDLHDEKVKATQSRSRSRPKYDARTDSERLHSPSPPKRPRILEEEQSALSSILTTLKEVQEDLKSTNARVTSLETCWRENCPPKLSVASDTLSVLAYLDEDRMSDRKGLCYGL